MSEWLFWVGLGYLIVTVAWFTFWLAMRSEHSMFEAYEEQAQEAAWWATRAPLWPFYLARFLSRATARLMVDAVKGRPKDE